MSTDLLKKHALVEISSNERPNILIDIVYATKNNFMNEVLYPYPACFFHEHVKAAVLNLADDLARMGLGIKIWDGYRPLHVQKKMWDKIQDERFVANPYKNKGRHTRGTAIDLTLIDKEGNELQMPTEFDSFETRAAHDFNDLPQEILEHRRMLRKIMEKHNFEHLPSEWWHYDFKGWSDEELYPALDLTFQEVHSSLLN